MGQRWLNGEKDHGIPFGWWGHRMSPPNPLSVPQLISEGNLDARIAAFLWLALERKASIVVAAMPDEAGKTTLLTALLDFLPADIETIYLRGWYEQFEFLESATPDRAYLLCNEISSHLPSYLWGRGVRRMFEAMQQGYNMATTVHVDGAPSVIDLLTSYPLEVPRHLIPQIDLVLTLSAGARASGLLRRLMRVEVISGMSDGDRLEVETVAERDVLLGPLTSRPGRLIGVLSERFGIDRDRATVQLACREQFLDRLARDGVHAIEDVRQAIQEYRHEDR